MKNPLLTYAAALAVGLTAFAGNAGANLVVNGNFETGTSAGWTLNGSLQWIASPYNGTPAQGNYAWQYNAYPYAPASISQTVATVAGAQYTLSFDSSVIGGTPNFFAVSIGDQTLYSRANSPNYGWTTSTFVFTANQSAQTLIFTGASDPLWVELDNVSLAATVPEPSTYIAGLLLLSGTAARFHVRRRKR